MLTDSTATPRSSAAANIPAIVRASLISPSELAQAVRRRGRARYDRLVMQVTLRSIAETIGCLVAAVAVLFQAFITIQSNSPRTSWSAWRAPLSPGRDRRQSVLGVDSRVLGLGGSSSRMIRRISSYAASQSLLVKRRRAGQQLVEQHAQAIDVAARVHVQSVRAACSGDMYSGVPMIWAKLVNSVLSVSCWPVALAMPKSMTFTTGVPSCSVTSTFDGLRSRWMIPFWWACCTAWQTR